MTNETQNEGEEIRKHLAALLAVKDSDAEIRAVLAGQNAGQLGRLLDPLPLVEIRRICTLLDPAICAEVLAGLPPEEGTETMRELGPGNVSKIIETMAPRDAAGLMAGADAALIEDMLKQHPTSFATISDAYRRRAYAPGTAGHLMTNDFVRLEAGMTAAEAIDRMRRTGPSRDMPNNLYMVEPAGPGRVGERLMGRFRFVIW